MTALAYVPLAEVAPAHWLALLNKPRVREHLVAHAPFDTARLAEWLAAKAREDAAPGCRIRAVLADGHLAGWCGLQAEDGGHELAVVLDDAYWGLGRPVFRQLMAWARELGHETVFVHLHHSRPEYRFLRRLARNVRPNRLLGEKFLTYELPVA